MTLDKLIDALEEMRGVVGGQARVVLPGKPMPAVRSVESVVAMQLRPNAYADARGLGGHGTENVIIIKS